MARISYEWDIETLTGGKGSAGVEIGDHNHRDALDGYATSELVEALSPDSHKLLCLVRDDEDGRSWAYVNDGELDEWFRDAEGYEVRKVPKLFRREFERALKLIKS
jgi:hypothetical protein